MKNKILKSTLLISLAATSAVVVPVLCVTSKTVADSNQVEPEKTSSVVNSTSRVTVKFSAGSTGATLDGPTSIKVKSGVTFGSIAKPTAYKDKHIQSYWINKSDDKKVSDSTIITAGMEVYPYFEADVKLENCLSIIALEHTKFNVTHYGTNRDTTKPNILYSTDGLKWDELSGSTVDILPGSALYLRGKNPNGVNRGLTNYSQFSMSGTVHLSGSAMALIDDGQHTVTEIPNTYCFARLFENCSGVKIISSNFLPAATLKAHCYESMFKNCTTLETFPNFLLQNASTLAERCYANMFENCISLTAIPTGLLSSLTDLKLAKECYYQMFRGCTKLTTLSSGTLPGESIELAEGCYTDMFRECTGITSLADDLLPATKLATLCYYGMFESCSGLTGEAIEDLELPATTLAEYCYKGMFYNCQNITTPPVLGATTLAKGCYHSMFYNCASLTSAPALSVETLAEECYAYMFYDCASLLAAPNLASKTLAAHCYDSMFYYCKAMTTGPTSLLATTLKPYCYQNMFFGCTELKKCPTFPTSGTVTLGEYCCNSMFKSCSTLTESPALIATTAVEGCYQMMFDYCSGITKAGEISLETFADYACYFMFAECSSLYATDDTKSQGYKYTKIFYVPESTSANYNRAVTSMFQGSGNSYLVTPGDEKTYYYRTAQ